MEIGKFYQVAVEDYGNIFVNQGNGNVRLKLKPMLKDEQTGDVIEKGAIIKPIMKQGKVELDVIKRVTDLRDTSPGK